MLSPYGSDKEQDDQVRVFKLSERNDLGVQRCLLICSVTSCGIL
jgi:hypothetical protein